MNKISVTKRSGKKEPLDIEKLHKVVENACEGLSGVSASEVELKSQLQFFDGMKTADIQETLIKAAADLIDEDSTNYQYVAGRLINYHLRKDVYGQYNPLPLYDIVKKNVKAGVYTDELLEWFTPLDFEALDRIVDHSRDEDIPYGGMEQFRGKYLVKNRVTKQIYETPQVALVLIAAILFRNYPNRMKWIKDYYDAVSKFYVSLATPIMAGIRTRQKQFSSCVLVDVDDDLFSIGAASTAILKYVSQRAGIGVNMGRLRGVDSEINGGLASHTGDIPFYRLMQSSIKSCSQGGVRGGAGNLNVVFWTLEMQDILVLKNNKGTEFNRVRQVDYTIQLNRTMYERVLSGGNISLFSTSDVPGLYEAYFRNTDEFQRLYEAAEADTSIRRITVPAVELFSALIQERKDTGRIYIMNVDNANEQSPFIDDLIYMTNLCVEILEPTKPMKHVFDEEGRIALCTLSAINWGNINNKYEFEKYCTLAVRGLNEILDYQEYPIPAAAEATKDYRSLGIGITNFAYWLAKNGYTYQHPTKESLEHFDEWCEAWSYYIIKASADLAKERGTTCRKSDNTKYSKGLVPFDWRKPAIDDIVAPQLRMPWEPLREQMIEHGIMNTPLMAQMPTETSSQPAGATNGFEPPRAIVSNKGSKDGVLPQVVPEPRKLKNRYDPLWEQRSPQGYLKYAAVLSKWMDQSGSWNISYNPEFFEKQLIPMSVMLTDIVDAYRWGLKTLYYQNTNDGAGEHNDDETQILEDVDDANCDGCVL